MQSTNEPLEALVGGWLRRQGLWLATAESCTGGLVADRITDVPGSSDYFKGGVVAYANQAKVELLGVNPETLAQYGAVSEQTALEMARGARRALGADIGLSTTGVAGPGGGSPHKPVGLVWIALSAPDRELASSQVWPGDRLAIKAQSAQAALALLAGYLNE